MTDTGGQHIMGIDPTDPEGWHQCHFCGQDVDKDGYEDSAHTKRHFLSDCRPDLVEHEIGPICTWPLITEPGYEYLNEELGRPNCYAYQDSDGKWTEEHIHFYPDGPM